jgi:hypothetical protein
VLRCPLSHSVNGQQHSSSCFAVLSTTSWCKEARLRRRLAGPACGARCLPLFMRPPFGLVMFDPCLSYRVVSFTTIQSNWIDRSSRQSDWIQSNWVLGRPGAPPAPPRRPPAHDRHPLIQRGRWGPAPSRHGRKPSPGAALWDRCGCRTQSNWIGGGGVLGVLILGAAAFYSLLVLEQHSNSTCAKNPDAKFDAEAPFQPCKDEHSKREARVSTDIKTDVTGLAIAPRHPPRGRSSDGRSPKPRRQAFACLLWLARLR